MAKQTFTTGQVLTAAQMISLQQTAMQGGAASAKTASYTLVAADAGTAISMSNASATTITVNTALFAAGDTVYITNLGAGVCTITAGTATVNSSASLALAQYESGFLDFTSTSAAIFVKGAGAAAASGSMTLLSTTTLAGTVTTVSSINQTYKDLLVTVSNATWDTSDDAIAFYTNLSSVTSFVKLSNSAVTATNLSTNVGDFSDGVQNYLRTGGNNFTSLYIQDYSATSRYKNFQGYSIYQGTTNNGRRACLIGGFASNTAISSVSFKISSDENQTAGTMRIYGVN